MTPDNSNLSAFVPVYDAIPVSWDDAQAFLTEQLKQISIQLNNRTNGLYYNVEQLSGNQLFPGTANTQESRAVFRKVIDIAGLPNFGVTNPKNVAHGITTTQNTYIVKLYGAATRPGVSTLTSGIPLPYVDTGANSISLSMDATNIILTGSGNYSLYTSAFVVVEYVQEA